MGAHQLMGTVLFHCVLVVLLCIVGKLDVLATKFAASLYVAALYIKHLHSIQYSHPSSSAETVLICWGSYHEKGWDPQCSCPVCPIAADTCVQMTTIAADTCVQMTTIAADTCVQMTTQVCSVTADQSVSGSATGFTPLTK
jgi:hypothetical protein